MLGVVGWVNRHLKRECSMDFDMDFMTIPSSIQFLRDIRSFFATSFKIVSADPSDQDCSQLIYSCYGTGYVNASRTLA